MEEQEPKAVLLPTTAEAIRLAKTLLRTARHAALASIEPKTGWPIATRVGVSTDIDGAPTILISALAAHTPALIAEPRCALLIGETGKGDPLAHARVSLSCRAARIERGSEDDSRIGARYLAHQPKAELYAGLGDFRYFRLQPESLSLNAGFGRAYALAAADILTLTPANEELAAAEPGALAHMNDDHSVAVGLYARHFAKAPEGSWQLVGIDAEGIDLADGDDIRRVFFETPLTSALDLRMRLVHMAEEARSALNS